MSRETAPQNEFGKFSGLDKIFVDRVGKTEGRSLEDLKKDIGRRLVTGDLFSGDIKSVISQAKSY